MLINFSVSKVKTYKEKEDALVKSGGANRERLCELKEKTITRANAKVSCLLHQLALLTSSP